MKIISFGYKPTGYYRYTCTNCSCEFEYHLEEVGTLVEVRGPDVSRYPGLCCPCCGYKIHAGSLSDARQQVVESYTASEIYDKRAEIEAK